MFSSLTTSCDFVSVLNAHFNQSGTLSFLSFFISSVTEVVVSSFDCSSSFVSIISSFGFSCLIIFSSTFFFSISSTGFVFANSHKISFDLLEVFSIIKSCNQRFLFLFDILNQT